MRRLVAVLALAALLAPALSSAAAAACRPRTSVADLEDEVMCLVCGTSLALAHEAPSARRERAFIARLVRECRTKKQIKDAMVGQFGPAVLALPRDRGFDVAAYLVPVLVLLAVALGLAFATVRRRGRQPGSRAEPMPEPLDPARAARVEADLRLHDPS